MWIILFWLKIFSTLHEHVHSGLYTWDFTRGTSIDDLVLEGPRETGGQKLGKDDKIWNTTPFRNFWIRLWIICFRYSVLLGVLCLAL